MVYCLNPGKKSIMKKVIEKMYEEKKRITFFSIVMVKKVHAFGLSQLYTMDKDACQFCALLDGQAVSPYKRSKEGMQHLKLISPNEAEEHVVSSD